MSLNSRSLGQFHPAAVGSVTSVGTDSFVVTTRDDTTVTVDVSSSTTYHEMGVASPTLADVTTGKTVAIFGTESSDTVAADLVAIRTAGGWGVGSPS